MKILSEEENILFKQQLKKKNQYLGETNESYRRTVQQNEIGF